MDFVDKIKQISERILNLKEKVETEEATKNAFIMPFIQALEYDIFNPNEVVPEFVADVGVKKGEKVDYAIMIENQSAILIECKCCIDNLEKHDAQLYRYFSVTKAKFAILTNGIIYKFYTDLDETNKLDKKPFLIFNMLDFDDNQLIELKKFCKSSFNVENIVSTASELKYTREVKNLFYAEYSKPSDEFIRFFAAKTYEGRLTQPIIEKFGGITQKAFKQFVNEIINERFQSALVKETPDKEVTMEKQDTTEKKPEAETTIEELEGFAIIKSILRGKIELERIAYRDNLSYFNVLVDDNIRKTLCRLYFNTKQKYISFLEDNKKENKIPIDRPDDIYNHAELLMQSLSKLNN